MATYYIDPAGVNGDGSIGSPFNSLYNAWAAIATAFNAATEDYVINCLAGQDGNAGNESATNPVILDPSTASATARVLRFIASGANRHTGTRGTGYRLPQVDIRWNSDNTNVTLELVGISTGSVQTDRAVAALVTVDSCLFADGTGANGVRTGGGTITARNTAVINPGFHAFIAESNNGVGAITAVNCTAAGANAGCDGFNGAVTAINCYAGDSDGADWNTSGSRTNCFSEDGTQSTTTAAYTTATFTSVTGGSENLKLAAASALIAAGVGPGSNGSVPSTDFEGTSRSGATTDVGFDQRTASGGGSSIAPRAQAYYRRRRAA